TLLLYLFSVLYKILSMLNSKERKQMPEQEGRQKYERVTVMALSIYAPWPWAIFHAEPRKNIENRHWPTSYRGWIAIHQSKKRITKPYYEEFLSTYKDLGGNLMKVPHRDEFLLGAIVGLVRMVACVKRHASPWFQGNWGWVLEDPIVLPEPIEINGQTGLWGL